MISAQCVRKNVYGCNHKEEWVALKDRYVQAFTSGCASAIRGKWKIQTHRCPAIISFTTALPYGLAERKRVQAEEPGD